MADAVARAGQAPLGPDPEALRRIGTFVELHVEQGRALADLGRAVAVGTAIHPHGRWRIDLAGRADHAGTTRLVDRDDPMLAFARVVLAARAAAERHGAVATCGKVRRRPERRQRDPVAGHRPGWTRGVTTPSGCARSSPTWPRAGGVADRGVVDRPHPVRSRRWPSGWPSCWTTRRCCRPGPGTTPGILAAAGIPTAMLYVRNPTGVSHSPEEHAEDADCAAGVTALTAVLRHLTSGGAQ